MGGLSISQAWEETKAIVAREGRLLAAVALALIVLPQVVIAVIGVPVGADAAALSSLLLIVVILLGFVAQIAFNRLAIGPSVTVADAIAVGFVRVVPFVLVVIVVVLGLAVIAGAIATILSAAKLMTVPTTSQTVTPSLLLLIVVLIALGFAIFQLAFPIAAVETGNPIRIFMRSWQLSRRHYLRLLGFVVVVFLGVLIIGLLNRFAIGSVILLLFGQPNPGSLSALLLGLIGGTIQAAFTVVAAVMLARIYLQLAVRDAQAGVPNSGI